jgi:tRNA (cmo5U34)-methyltransferase
MRARSRRLRPTAESVPVAPPNDAPVDDLYSAALPVVTDFDFGTTTTAVFDDMLQRSIPFYDEIQRMIGELANDFAVDGTRVYDLGCSTGATLLRLSGLSKDITLVGIDSSSPMLAHADRALRAAEVRQPFELRRQDLHDALAIDNASVVIACLTLQFVRPLHRDRLLRAIYEGMNERGALIVVEKVLEEETLVNRLFIKHYYDFKRRNHYSDLEIAQKREALENVLVPYRLEENRQMLRAAGFRHPEVFFKWYNFAGLLAVK